MIDTTLVLLLFFIIPGIFIFFLKKKISLSLKLIDNPNINRKKIINQKTTYLFNGLIVLLNISFYLLFEIMNEITLFQNLLILFVINIFYIVGYFDDLKNLTAISKTALIFIIIFFLLIIDKNFLVTELRFKNLMNNIISIDKFSIPITIFFIYIFYNFLNFSDGINGIAIGLSIFFILVLIYERQNYMNLEIVILYTLIMCLIINLKNISFLGNSGVSVLGVIIPLLYIRDYNLNNAILCDEIFIIFFIPGIDMTRLVIERIIKKKSIAKADLNHLHHLILTKYNKDKCFVIYILLSITPYLISKLLNDYKLAISLSLIFYFIIIIFFKKERIKSF